MSRGHRLIREKMNGVQLIIVAWIALVCCQTGQMSRADDLGSKDQPATEQAKTSAADLAHARKRALTR